MRITQHVLFKLWGILILTRSSFQVLNFTVSVDLFIRYCQQYPFQHSLVHLLTGPSNYSLNGIPREIVPSPRPLIPNALLQRKPFIRPAVVGPQLPPSLLPTKEIAPMPAHLSEQIMAADSPEPLPPGVDSLPPPPLPPLTPSVKGINTIEPVVVENENHQKDTGSVASEGISESNSPSPTVGNHQESNNQQQSSLNTTIPESTSERYRPSALLSNILKSTTVSHDDIISGRRKDSPQQRASLGHFNYSSDDNDDDDDDDNDRHTSPPRHNSPPRQRSPLRHNSGQGLVDYYDRGGYSSPQKSRSWEGSQDPSPDRRAPLHQQSFVGHSPQHREDPPITRRHGTESPGRAYNNDYDDTIGVRFQRNQARDYEDHQYLDRRANQLSDADSSTRNAAEPYQTQYRDAGVSHDSLHYNSYDNYNDRRIDEPLRDGNSISGNVTSTPFAKLTESLKILQQQHQQHVQVLPADTTRQPPQQAEPSAVVVEPSEDLRPVIDRLAEYVAKNGGEFETGIKEKQDPRFDFLNHWNMYHAYYLQIKNKSAKALEDEKEKGIYCCT